MHQRLVLGLVHAPFVGHLKDLSAQWLLLGKATKRVVAYGLLGAVPLASVLWLKAAFLRLEDAYGTSR